MAITGDVGAGKSKTADLFQKSLASYPGCLRIDADRVAAELWRTPEVVTAAAGRWGSGNILDASGCVTHQAVAGIIFGDREEYDWLMKLLHPLIKKKIEEQIALLPENQWAVVEIPLLFEVGAPSWVTVSVFVTAPRETRVSRCRARGWDEAELRRREKFFIPSEERMALSDYVIHNDGSLDKLKKAVEDIRLKISRLQTFRE